MTAIGDPTAVPRLRLPAWLSTPDRDRRDGPLVLDAALAATTAVRTWSPERLAADFGDVEVSVRRWVPDGARRRVRVETAALADFVAAMHRDTVFFAPAIDFETLPGLLGQLEPARLFPSAQAWADAADFLRLYLGDGMRMRLHWDVADLLLVQVHGRSHVVLEPPDSTAAHYPSPVWPTASVVDVDAPRPGSDFPLYTGAGRLCADLGPGDVLHIPRGWWYDIGADGRCIWVTSAYGPVLDVSTEVAARRLALSAKGA
jgi:hypothetical protein